MPIHADTALAEALHVIPGMLDLLVTRLGPDNALSRLISAGPLPVDRLCVSDLAAIAGVSAEALLEMVGENAQSEPQPALPPASPAFDPPPNRDWFLEAEQNCAVRIDVRPLLAKGRDPFTIVVEAAENVEMGAFLILDAPFDPAPLRRVLANKGFLSVGRPVEPGYWRICFRRGSGAPDAEVLIPTLRKPGETWREGMVTHVEVRNMMPPGPLTTVLRLVESGETDEILVHHDRDPILLYSELAERGWECVKTSVQGDEVQLLLRPLRATSKA